MNDKLVNDSVALIDKSIEELNKKASLTPSELESMCKAYDLRMKLLRSEREEDMGESHGWDHMDRNIRPYTMTHDRGRSPVTGRYISRDSMMYEDGMSGHSIKDRMIARLESMYDEAKSEHEREEIRKEIRRLEAER